MSGTRFSIRALCSSSLALMTLALSACAHDGMTHPTGVDPAVVADIERCGVDIQMSKSLRIRISHDANGGGVSAGTLSEIRSTIFSKVPEADRLAVYNSYVACVSNRAALESEIAEVDQKKLRLMQEIRTRYPEVTEDEIRLLAASYDKEASELRSGELVKARSTRGQTVYAIVEIANRHHFNPGGLVSTYSYAPSQKPESAQEEQQRFMKVCLAAADEALCENALLRLRSETVQSTVVH